MADLEAETGVPRDAIRMILGMASIRHSQNLWPWRARQEPGPAGP